MLSRKRTTIAVGIIAATAAIMTSSVALASSDPADPKPSCAEAITAYQKAQDNANISAASREAAQRNYDAAKKDLATYDSTHGGKDQPPVVKADRDKLVANVDAASVKLQEAQERYKNDNSAANNSKAAADTACQGAQGPQGPAGVDGRDGIDAKVILSPNVCARALVRPDTKRLVKVIVLIPCPLVTPPPPETAPNPGDQVVIINNTAPKPNTVDSHLPVTH